MATDNAEEIYEVVVQGVAKPTYDKRKYSFGEFFHGYIKTTLEPDELAADILRSLRDRNIYLYRSYGMQQADIDRIDIRVRTEGIKIPEPEYDFNSMVNEIDKNATLGMKQEKASHHMTGPGSTAKRRMRTGVHKEYKKEYEDENA